MCPIPYADWLPENQVERLGDQDDSRVPQTRVDPEPAPPVRAARLPPNWPQSVPGPTAPGWTHAAVNYLLDQVPSGSRAYARLFRAHPLVLARMALTYLLHAHRAMEEGYRSAAYQLRPLFEPHTIAEILATYQAERTRIVQRGRAARLVEQALLAREPRTGARYHRKQP